MLIRHPLLRAGLAFAVTVIVGGALWFDWEARTEGFAGWFDRRDARAAGILSGAEWRAMRAAGDTAPAAMGGDGCVTEACRTAQAQAGGRWAGIGDCASGDVYRFADGFVEVTSHQGGRPTTVVRRSYRVVTAPVTLRLLRGADGGPIERSLRKLPGDVEVFTLGRSSYVRRILRAAGPDRRPPN
jgi:hypothetical protein